MMRLHNRLVDFLDQQLAPDFLFQWRVVRLEEAAFAGNALNDTLALQFAVRFGDRVAVDAQLLRERPNGRQRLTRVERARSRGGFDLVHDLKIDRLAGTKVYLQQHT